MRITAKRCDGKVVTLRPGQALCGFSFSWVRIEGGCPSESRIEWEAFRAWLEHLLTCKLRRVTRG